MTLTILKQLILLLKYFNKIKIINLINKKKINNTNNELTSFKL